MFYLIDAAIFRRATPVSVLQDARECIHSAVSALAAAFRRWLTRLLPPGTANAHNV